MGWVEGTLVFVAGIIIFMVMLPIGQALLPSMQDTMGGTVVLMVSTMFTLILVLIFFIYFKQSQQPDNFMAGGQTGEQF
jgi:hypothetical protein